MISNDQSEFTSWSWEIALMLKLHPTQLSVLSLFPPSPHPPSRSPHSRRGSPLSTTPPDPVSSHSQPTENTDASEQGAKSASVYKRGGPIPGTGFVEGVDLPNLANSNIPGFEHLRDSVQRQGLVAGYTSMSLSSMGSESVLSLTLLFVYPCACLCASLLIFAHDCIRLHIVAH